MNGSAMAMVKLQFRGNNAGFATGVAVGDPAATLTDDIACDVSTLSLADPNAGIVDITTGLAAAAAPSASVISPSTLTMTTSQSLAPSFVINPVFASSITNLPSVLAGQIEAAITTAISSFESLIVTNETLTINFGYGTVGTTTTAVTGLGASTYPLAAVPYSQLRSALVAHASTISALSGLAASLPTTDPTGGGAFYITPAEAGALGLTGVNIGVAGNVGISSSDPLGFTASGTSVVGGGYWAVGVFEHEISEVLGRVQSLGVALGSGNYTPFDLFRYANPGSMDLAQGGIGYFSVNNGTTDLGNFNTLLVNGDLADWAAGVQDDAFSNSAAINTVNTISAGDLMAMTALGYSLACYCQGTRIRTARGEIAVEHLMLGERVSSALGGTAEVMWLGHRRVDCSRHPRPRDVWPVRVAAGAFDINLPVRDLWLSPDHAVYVDDILIPVRYLINDRTIAQVSMDEVMYWHVELPCHDVLLAEGLPAESYLDTGNRTAFANAADAVMMTADFALKVWEAEACARLVCDGPALAAVRLKLLERAEALGHAVTNDAALHIRAGGSTIAATVEGRMCRFDLAPGTGEISLLSRSAVPASLLADSVEHRRLGVAVARITLDGEAIALTDPRLGAGWHSAETDDAGGPLRWTNGDAVLKLAGGGLLEIEVAMNARYWLNETPQSARVA